MADVFLSYSREDQPTARRFAEGLTREGFGVWWDQSLTIGEAFDKTTEKALDDAKAVVVLWSKTSVDSRWVRAEATQAQASGRLAPVMIESCKRPIMFELTHTADLSGWNGDFADARWRSFVAELKRFVMSSAPIDAASPAIVSPPSAPTTADSTTSRGMRSRAGLALGALGALAILGIIGGLWWKLRSIPAQPVVEASSVAIPSATTSKSAPVTLAVLPFANLSPDPNQEYFSDGLTEEILNQLAQIHALRVAGRTSSFSFKGKNEDLRVIAKKLDVNNLLEGSVRKDGDNLRITAQLIDGREGAHLWSRTYDRPLSGVFDLQDEVARDVARALSVTLDVGDIRRAEGGTTNVEAWDRFLQARTVRMTTNDIDRYIRLLREAVQLDSGFALAWNQLGDILIARADALSPERGESLRREGRSAKARALNLTPDASWVRMEQATDLLKGRKWAQAEAMAVSVKDERPWNSAEDSERGWPYWSLLRATGRTHEALQLHQQFLQIEPQAPGISSNYQTMLIGEADCAGVEVESQRSRSFVNNSDQQFFPLLCQIAQQGDRGAIIVGLRRAQDFRAGMWKALFIELSRVHGDKAAVSKALRTAYAAARPGAVFWPLARLADAYRDRDMVLTVIERQEAQKIPQAAEIIWQFPWSGVRSDPRFKEVVRKFGLYEYWRSTGNWADHCKPLGTDDFECS